MKARAALFIVAVAGLLLLACGGGSRVAEVRTVEPQKSSCEIPADLKERITLAKRNQGYWPHAIGAIRGQDIGVSMTVWFDDDSKLSTLVFNVLEPGTERWHSEQIQVTCGRAIKAYIDSL